MSEGFKTSKGPNSGAWVLIVMELIMPALALVVVYPVIMRFQEQYPQSLNFWESMTVAGAVGTLFSMIMMVSAGGKEIKKLFKRIWDFFSYLSISFKAACEIYKLDLSEDGILLWIHILLLAANGTLFGVSFSLMMEYMQPYL